MIGKPLHGISRADLDALLGCVGESKTLEFKSAWSSKDEDRALVEGVSALANTMGGDFMVGVAANKTQTRICLPRFDRCSTSFGMLSDLLNAICMRPTDIGAERRDQLLQRINPKPASELLIHD